MKKLLTYVVIVMCKIQKSSMESYIYDTTLSRSFLLPEQRAPPLADFLQDGGKRTRATSIRGSTRVGQDGGVNASTGRAPDVETATFRDVLRPRGHDSAHHGRAESAMDFTLVFSQCDGGGKVPVRRTSRR